MSDAFADSWRAAQSIAAVSENAEWIVRVEPGESMGDVFGFAGTPKGEYAEATGPRFLRHAKDDARRAGDSKS